MVRLRCFENVRDVNRIKKNLGLNWNYYKI